MPIVYQILEWDAHFENFKSRTVARCGFVCVPNKQHGEGVTYILSLSDGLAVYGAWNLILGACSQHEADPKASPPFCRDGWLTNDGRQNGKPWTARLLGIRWRRSEKEIQRSLEVFCSTEVGWIIAHSVSDDGYQADTLKPLNGIELKGIEGKKIARAAHACPLSADEPTTARNFLDSTGEPSAQSETSPQGDRSLQSGTALKSATFQNPIKKPEALKSAGSPQGVDAPKGAKFSTGFSAFWAEYPRCQRKVGKTRCFRLWKRAGFESVAEQVIASLRRCKVAHDWTKNAGEFIPLPLTWLNQAPWETDPEDLIPENATPDDLDPADAAMIEEMHRERITR